MDATIENLRIPLDAGDSVGATIACPGNKWLPVGVLLAHGAGNDRFSPLLVHVQRALAGAGVVCVTFNFPYKERGRRLPDPLPVLMAAYGGVVDRIRTRFHDRVPGWVLGGKSLGGRVAAHVVASGEPAAGLVFLGYPLHPAGKPQPLRIEPLAHVTVPMLFVQGTRDPLCDLSLLQRWLQEQTPSLRLLAQLVTIEAADHSFVLPRRLGREQEEVYREIAAHVERWLSTTVVPRTQSGGNNHE